MICIEPFFFLDVTDSSGMRFFYVNTRREHDAGVLYVGHSVHPLMIIPPGTDNYTISGICAANCTERVRNIQYKLAMRY